MRDIIVTLIILGALPLVLKHTYVGVLLWSWISYMNPHRLTWGFAYSFPFAMIVGITTLLSLFTSRDSRRMPWTPITVVLLVFALWTSFTTLFAIAPDDAFKEWDRFIKICLMTFVTLLVIVERRQLDALVWVVVLSLGFYGVKGGIFTLLTGAQYQVLGPEGSFFSENNEMAFTLVMFFPLMRYLQLQSESRLVRLCFSGAMIFTVFAILGSYSRGAFLAVSVMAIFMTIKSRKKLLVTLIALLLVPIAISFMPEKWHQRIETIETYQEDRSAMGRINAWIVSINIAKAHPIVGGGFGAFDRNYYGPYLPKGFDPYVDPIAGDVHSIYFEVLGEHGIIGLILFLTLGLLTFRTGTWVIWHTRKRPDLFWARDLASMIQVSLVGYAVGGAFLGLAYFDLFYTLVALQVCTQQIVRRELGLAPPLRERQDAVGRPAGAASQGVGHRAG
ncbi:MAG TPA: putative O-glycosylation ligase, exosortase A system-associated [Gammaproteobacteria bacterium]|nr:putative O-glycosylation ligase, exosortase A system-associated [Gammaproteobacteria bacterium]